MNTFEIALRTGTLPDNPLELAKMKYFGESALRFLRDNLAKANELEIPEEQRKNMLEEGQKIGIALLDAEAKIGELLPKVPDGLRIGEKYKKASEEVNNSLEDFGIKKHQAKISRTINNHPEIVKEAIQEAIDNEDIPTKTLVLNKIKHKKEMERKENAEQRKKDNPELYGKTNLEITIEEQEFIMFLEEMIRKFPVIPKDWHGNQFALAKGYAEILIKRLEVFNEQK